MNLYTFYFSPTGSTKRVLDCVSNAWTCQRVDIDLSAQTTSLSALVFQPDDVCIVAVPSFSGRVPQFLVPRLGELDGGGAKAVLITAFGNRAFDDTLIELRDILTAAGFLCICAVAAVTQHSLLPHYGKGRPDAADLAELNAFAARCRAAVERGTTAASIPGNTPYRPYLTVPIQPKANRRCIGCGLCAKRCPVHAISSENLRSTESQKCISCMQCVTACPQHARRVNGLMQRVAEQKMKKLCADKKENQLFCPDSTT